MTIRNRTNPPRQKPRKALETAPVYSTKLGTNPPSLDTPYLPTGPVGQRPAPRPPVPAPYPNTGVVPPVLYPEPVAPVTPMPKPPVVDPTIPPKPPYPEVPVVPVPPKPPYPEGPNMGIPESPSVLNPQPLPVPTTPPVTGTNPPVPPTGPLPQGFGLDFMREVTPNELVANQLDTLLNSNSPYMRNAAQRGAEFAASRGNLNSSIGAGAASRAALEAAMPIAQADAQVYRDANAGNFDSLSQLRQMRVAGDIENWLSSETYNREFNGQLAMLPITSSIDMLQYIMQRGMEDPAVYPPDVLSGISNFFNGNMFDVLNRFYGTNPAGGD